jgi:hypothetical protein
MYNAAWEGKKPRSLHIATYQHPVGRLLLSQTKTTRQLVLLLHKSTTVCRIYLESPLV